MSYRLRDSRLDIVRFIGMCLVIGFHLGELMWTEQYFFPISLESFWSYWQMQNFSLLYLFLLAGDHGVPLFIFLSGFLMAEKSVNYSYVLKRIGVVWSQYALAVVLGGIGVGLFLPDATDLYDRTVLGQFSWMNIIWSLLLVQNWREATFNSPLPSWWFVPILIQLYVLFGLFLGRMHRDNSRVFLKKILRLSLGWNFVVILLAVFLPETYVFPFYFSGMSYIGVFGLGMWWQRVGRFLWLPLRGGELIMFGWFLRILTGRWFFAAEMLIGWGWFELGLSLAMLLQRFSIVERCMAYIGRVWSYKIYLWHQFVLYILWIYLLH